MTGTALDGRRLKPSYDVIICGSGSSGSVIARRLSEIPTIQVLLLEAGGDDQRPTVTDAARWPENVGSDLDWGFVSEPGRFIDRPLPMGMGKVLGGGSAINAMIWSRGHRRDWDHFAEVTGDPAWNYASVLSIYQRIEHYRGLPDDRRGVGGLLSITQPDSPSPLAPALLEAARAAGIPTFASPNGAMMEATGGAAIADVRLDAGRRLTVFGAYVRPVLSRPNLTVLPGARVLRVLFDGRRACGVEIDFGGATERVFAAAQVVLSAGAINTPQLLMLSGIGDGDALREHGLDVVQHLPGVGVGLQDHTSFPTTWEHPDTILSRDNGSEAMLFASSLGETDGPDTFMCQAEFPFMSAEIARFGVPAHGWTAVAALSQPKSRGQVRLRSADPFDAPVVQLNALSDPDDLLTARAVVKLSREVGWSEPFRRLGARDLPAAVRAMDVDTFIRNSAMPFFHQSCTARMGRDGDSVVGGDLKVHGLANLTVADASVMPRITAGNTMAPCVIIGERAGQILVRELA
jgi:choline dehydrogenase